MFPLVTLPFVHFCAFVYVQRYNEFFFLNVSFLAILRVFDRNNFPKKMSDFLSVFCITLFFLEIISLPKESKKSSFGNVSFIHSRLAEISSRRRGVTFDCIFANSLTPIFRGFFDMNLPCPRRYLGFRFREIFTSTVVFREFASFGRER